jgi:hypothetical protein
MARQDVDIGVEGNDGTGDSIRESFRKVNENFQEVYAVFGEGGSVDFTSLGDTPENLLPNTLPFVNSAATALNLVELASNSALDETANDTITFDYTQEGKLVISTAFTKLSDDTEPLLGGPLNVNDNPIAKVAISQQAVNDFNTRHNTDINIDDLVITKGYADRRYVTTGLPIRVADEPQDRSTYVLEIDRYIGGDIEIVDHGFDRTINGTPFVFDSRYNDPNGLSSETTYFLRFKSDDRFSIFSDRETAEAVDDDFAEGQKIFVSGDIASDDTHRLIDAGFDPSLQGNFLADVAIPRKSAVRRQGDTMEGLLNLSDHPGDLSGFGIIAGDDDLQAATKLYVDNTSFSSTENLFVSTSGDDRMIGVPPGREGTALDYAYRTVNAAAQRAEEIVKTSQSEPGPYFQTITTNNGGIDAVVTNADVVSPENEQTRSLIELNREYIIKEVQGYLSYEYPDFIYDVDEKEQDIADILDSIAFDINRGLNANILTRQVAERYYSNPNNRQKITRGLTQTVDAIDFAKAITNSILNNSLYREKLVDTIEVTNGRAIVTTNTNHGLKNTEHVVFKNMGGMVEIENQSAYVRKLDDTRFELYEDPQLLNLWDISDYTDYTTGGRIGVVYQNRIQFSQDDPSTPNTIEDFKSIKIRQTFDQPNATPSARNAVGDKFDLITNILQNGIEAGADVIFGSNYKLVLDNGNQTFVDQGNPESLDTIPGKVIVGKESGARGRIVSLVNNDGTENNNDTFELIPLNAKDFLPGESVEYGNFVKNKQVTIFIESGIYQEDYPIRLANNVSLKGDEFRRVIIRPKRRISQSTWSDIYFYRDLEFDEISLLNKRHSEVTQLNGSAPQFIVTDDTSWMSINQSVRFIGNNLIGAELSKNTVYFVTGIISSTEFTVSDSEGGNDISFAPATGQMYVVDADVSAFLNQTNQVQGYFGRHYLENPYAAQNVGIVPANSTAFSLAADIVSRNKNFVIEEIIEYINLSVATANNQNDTSSIWYQFTYDEAEFRDSYKRVIDSLIIDLDIGNAESSLEVQGFLYENVTADFPQFRDAYGQISVLLSQLLQSTEPVQNGDIRPDISQGSAETGTVSLVGNLLDLIEFAFDSSYNPPKRNDADGVDVFMMSDATIVRNVTVQGHGGFMVVLDPEGQILTKSPYIQTGSSFSKSDNEKRFRGGMYVDAFVGNIPARITNVVDAFTLDLESDTGQGLAIRPPELPAPFYLDGARYQVNAISDYDSAEGTVRIFLDKQSNPDAAGVGQGYSGSTPQEIFIQTAGNRSMLGNDFTQINDLGYGLVTNNGAVSEMVSMFTYYCQAAYYAKNGSEIRSLNGSNGYGNFGLIAEGADPNEIPDQVTLSNPMVQPAKSFVNGNNPNSQEDPFITIYDLAVKPTTDSIITIDHGAAIGVLNYRISAVKNLSDTDNDGIEGDSASDLQATDGVVSNSVYQLSIVADNAVNDDFFGQLQANVPNGTIIEYRDVRSLQFSGVRSPEALETRPSTAINFDESDAVTYRSLDFSTADSFSQDLPDNTILSTIELDFNFVELEVDLSNLDSADPDDGTKTQGSQAGDNKIAVVPLDTPSAVTRLLRDVTGLQPSDSGYSGGMIFAYAGKTHKVVNYIENSGTAYIEIEDVAGLEINSPTTTNLASAIPDDRERSLIAGLPAGSTAEITVAISLLRATGHDFTQIGTGGYNDSNYPNVIFGRPENDEASFYTDAATATKSQVWERRKGRVFFVSTDQDGFFRVGKFFSVDQATGDITFSGEIGLTGANSLGFTRGVVINEFSADDSFADNSGQAVPTERATGGFINRVLGYNVRSNSQIEEAPTGNRIGPGFLPLNGFSAMEGDIDMGAFQVTNVGLPNGDGTAAANKNYVDDKAQAYDEFGDLRNIELNSVAKNDIVFATGKKRIFVTPVQGGTWNVGDSIGISGGSKSGTIVDLESFTDDIEGNLQAVTYTQTAGEFIVGETLFDLPGETANATIVDGPVDEFANASEDSDSVINVAVERTQSGATYDLQIQDDSIVNADINSSAEISQSKLNMQFADTFIESDATTGWNGTATKVQANLGLSKFSDENFETLDGYVRVKANGIAYEELQQIPTDTIIGRSQAGTGNVSAVPFSTVINQGGGLEDSDFTNTVLSGDTGFPGNALVQLEEGVYGTTEISTGTGGDTIVRRDSNGNIDAAGIKVGGFDILELSSTTIRLKTPGNATILEAVGTTTDSLVTKIPGGVDVGSTAITNESNFQSNSSYAGEGFIASDWLYTSFIEAPGERDTTSTGVSIGAGGGFANSAAEVVSLITGGAERLVVGNSTTTVENDLSISNALTVTGSTNLNGNVDLGNENTDTVSFSARVDSNIVPSSNGAYNVGTGALRWNTMYANVFNGVATEAKYADLAENYVADDKYSVGTVLIFGGDAEVSVTNKKGDTRVAGIVSQNPAYLMNSELDHENSIPLALQGRVPCKVLGRVQKGDLLVSSAIPEYAVVDNNPNVGSIIGKALENKDSDGKAVIEIVVGRV